MDRAQPSHQDQTRDVNAAEQNAGTDFAHRSNQQCLPEQITDPSAGTLNVVGVPPALQMPRLPLKQTRTRRDEENDPRQPRHQRRKSMKPQGSEEQKNEPQAQKELVAQRQVTK